MQSINRITRKILLSLLVCTMISPSISHDSVARVHAESSEYVEPEIDYSGSIPTTSNPFGNGTKGVRTMANPSF